MAAKFNQSLGKQFTPVKGNQLLVFKDGGITTMLLNEETFISGLLCQTINEQLMSNANCDETIQGLQDKLASKFVCQEECSKGKVIGNGS